MSKNTPARSAETETTKTEIVKTEAPKATDGGAVVQRASHGDLVTAEESGSIMDRMKKMSGAGMENVTAKDILIPRITILQSLSYQLKPNRPEYIAGATAGQFCDVALGELFEAPLRYVPVFFQVNYLEWLPNRKGLAGIHASPNILASTTLNDRKQPTLPNGNTIMETAQFYGLNLDAENRKSFIPMASTQLKKAKKWNTTASEQKKDGVLMPLFYRSYLLTTAPEMNEQGDWLGWKIEPGPTLDDFEAESKGAGEAIFKDAVELYESIMKGLSRADLESMAADMGGEQPSRHSDTSAM